MKSKTPAALGEDFIEQAKANFFNDIRPANPDTRTAEGYTAVVSIARSFFEKNDTDVLEGFLQRSQYFVQLWAAHMILEHGQPAAALKTKATDVIKKYARGCMNPEVIAEEKNWLAVHDMGT